jgi:hypothetical protein
VLRVLARIIAELDPLAGFPPLADAEEAKGEDAEAHRVRHRKRLAEPNLPPKRLSINPATNLIREYTGLAVSEGDYIVAGSGVIACPV